MKRGEANKSTSNSSRNRPMIIKRIEKEEILSDLDEEDECSECGGLCCCTSDDDDSDDDYDNSDDE